MRWCKKLKAETHAVSSDPLPLQPQTRREREGGREWKETEEKEVFWEGVQFTDWRVMSDYSTTCFWITAEVRWKFTQAVDRSRAPRCGMKWLSLQGYALRGHMWLVMAGDKCSAGRDVRFAVSSPHCFQQKHNSVYIIVKAQNVTMLSSSTRLLGL